MEVFRRFIHFKKCKTWSSSNPKIQKGKGGEDPLSQGCFVCRRHEKLEDKLLLSVSRRGLDALSLSRNVLKVLIWFSSLLHQYKICLCQNRSISVSNYMRRFFCQTSQSFCPVGSKCCSSRGWELFMFLHQQAGAQNKCKQHLLCQIFISRGQNFQSLNPNQASKRS